MTADASQRGAREVLVATIVAHDTVRRVARLLSPQGIPVMPLKGALLGSLVYASVAERPLSDVDLLVDPASFPRATALLEASGFTFFGWGELRTSIVLRAPGSSFLVDLHQRLFSPGWFRLRTEALFARARPDERLFDAPVRIPDGRDLYAHLVGHFVKGRLTSRDAVQLHDFAVTASRLDLRALDVAAHLEGCGLSRAARYALGIARDVCDDHFARDVLRALMPDPLGDGIARAARAALDGERAWLGRAAAIPAHLLNESLPAAGRALCLHGADAARRLSRRPSPSRGRR